MKTQKNIMLSFVVAERNDTRRVRFGNLITSSANIPVSMFGLVL